MTGSSGVKEWWGAKWAEQGGFNPRPSNPRKVHESNSRDLRPPMGKNVMYLGFLENWNLLQS